MLNDIIIEHFKAVIESCALLILTEEINTAVKLFYNELGNTQAEANTFDVNAFFLVLDRSINLEKQRLIFLFYPKPVINH